MESDGDLLPRQIPSHIFLDNWCPANTLNDIEDVLLLKALADPLLNQFHLLDEILIGSSDFESSHEVLYFDRSHVLLYVKHKSVMVNVQLLHIVFQQLFRRQENRLLVLIVRI